MQSRKTVKQALKEGEYIGVIELEDPINEGDYHIFEVIQNDKYITVGTMCNTGLFPDFWIEKDDTFSLDQHLEAIHELITEAIYNDELDNLNGLIEL